MEKLYVVFIGAVSLGVSEGSGLLQEFGPILNAGAVTVITALFIYEHVKRGPAREKDFQDAIKNLADSHEEAISKLGEEYKEALQKLGLEHKSTMEKLGAEHKETMERIGQEHKLTIEKSETHHKETIVALLTGFRDETRMNREDRAIDHAERRDERKAMLEVMGQVKEAIALSMNHVEVVSGRQNMARKT